MNLIVHTWKVIGVWGSSTLNCAVNLGSVLQKSRMSGMLYSFMAKRSSPIPNAQPIFSPAPPVSRQIYHLVILIHLYKRKWSNSKWKWWGKKCVFVDLWTLLESPKMIGNVSMSYMYEDNVECKNWSLLQKWDWIILWWQKSSLAFYLVYLLSFYISLLHL